MNEKLISSLIEKNLDQNKNFDDDIASLEQQIANAEKEISLFESSMEKALEIIKQNPKQDFRKMRQKWEKELQKKIDLKNVLFNKLYNLRISKF